MEEAFKEAKQYSLNERLLQAAAVDDQEKVKLLLEKGADINYGGHYHSALVTASSYGNQKMVELLIDKGAAVNDSKSGWCFALIFASIKGYMNITKLLLENGALDNENEAYKAAFLKGHGDISKLLLSKKKADVS